MQHRGFARTVGTDQAERLLAADLKVEAVEDLHLAVARPQLVDEDKGVVARQFRNGFLACSFCGNLLRFPCDFIHGNDGSHTPGVIAANPFRILHLH